MQPQDQQAPAASPGNSDPNYNFIFNGQQQAKKRFGFSLPGGNKLTKVVLLVVGGGTVLGILIIILSLTLGGSGIDSKSLKDIAAHGQEITRISELVVKESRDVNTLNLASTTSNAITSQDAELIAFMQKNHEKVVSKELKIYANKDTDTQVQTAAQNNRLSEYYYSYLKKNLTSYENSLKTAHNASSSTSLKALLQKSYTSTHTILSTQQIASSTAQ